MVVLRSWVMIIINVNKGKMCLLLHACDCRFPANADSWLLVF